MGRRRPTRLLVIPLKFTRFLSLDREREQSPGGLQGIFSADAQRSGDDREQPGWRGTTALISQADRLGVARRSVARDLASSGTAASQRIRSGEKPDRDVSPWRRSRVLRSDCPAPRSLPPESASDPHRRSEVAARLWRRRWPQGNSRCRGKRADSGRFRAIPGAIPGTVYATHGLGECRLAALLPTASSEAPASALGRPDSLTEVPARVCSASN